MSDNQLMVLAWRDFVMFAIGNEEIRAQYVEETGRTIFAPATSPLDRLIDEATASPLNDAEDFMLWATARIWGVDEAPEKVREAVAKSRYAEPAA